MVRVLLAALLRLRVLVGSGEDVLDRDPLGEGVPVPDDVTLALLLAVPLADDVAVPLTVPVWDGVAGGVPLAEDVALGVPLLEGAREGVPLPVAVPLPPPPVEVLLLLTAAAGLRLGVAETDADDAFTGVGDAEADPDAICGVAVAEVLPATAGVDDAVMVALGVVVPLPAAMGLRLAVADAFTNAAGETDAETVAVIELDGDDALPAGRGDAEADAIPSGDSVAVAEALPATAGVEVDDAAMLALALVAFPAAMGLRVAVADALTRAAGETEAETVPAGLIVADGEVRLPAAGGGEMVAVGDRVVFVRLPCRTRPTARS